jgi:transposase
LLSARKKTKPRQVDLCDVFCAVLYVLKSGCQWDMAPRDFPPKSAVYTYFKQWKERPGEDEMSLLERALKNQVGEARMRLGRSAQTTFFT